MQLPEEQIASITEEVTDFLWHKLSAAVGHGALLFTAHKIVEKADASTQANENSQNSPSWRAWLNPFHPASILNPSNIANHTKKIFYKLGALQTEHHLLQMARNQGIRPENAWNALYPTFQKFMRPIISQYLSQPLAHLLQDFFINLQEEATRVAEQAAQKLVQEATAEEALEPLSTWEKLNGVKVAKQLMASGTEAANILLAPFNELAEWLADAPEAVKTSVFTPPSAVPVSLNHPPVTNSQLERLQELLTEGLQLAEEIAPEAGKLVTDGIKWGQQTAHYVSSTPYHLTQGLQSLADELGVPFPVVAAGSMALTALAYYGLTAGFPRVIQSVMQRVSQQNTQNTTVDNSSKNNNAAILNLFFNGAPVAAPGTAPTVTPAGTAIMDKPTHNNKPF